MKLLSRILFLISLIILVIYSFDFLECNNRALLISFIIGFIATFISTFFVENDKLNTFIRRISAVIVISILAYILIFGVIWSFSKRP
ncbi:hypothetical protein SAMN05661091_3058 [Paenibacillus uliginis N3/975]|uniref:DUF3953 domain-containing protein n=1 Tax=Paenibacillus uliginis N3/975 TaxID=1313296 RepID=A0A1X7HFI3_9BACL|nr:hypothetical protein SAMN05661091_3058 [Paenibacillus uliginis N3/975]